MQKILNEEKKSLGQISFLSKLCVCVVVYLCYLFEALE